MSDVFSNVLSQLLCRIYERAFQIIYVHLLIIDIIDFFMDHLWLLLKRTMDIGQFALFTFCVERKQIQMFHRCAVYSCDDYDQPDRKITTHNFIHYIYLIVSKNVMV